MKHETCIATLLYVALLAATHAAPASYRQTSYIDVYDDANDAGSATDDYTWDNALHSYRLMKPKYTFRELDAVPRHYVDSSRFRPSSFADKSETSHVIFAEKSKTIQLSNKSPVASPQSVSESTRDDVSTVDVDSESVAVGANDKSFSDVTESTILVTHGLKREGMEESTFQISDKDEDPSTGSVNVEGMKDFEDCRELGEAVADEISIPRTVADDDNTNEDVEVDGINGTDQQNEQEPSTGLVDAKDSLHVTDEDNEGPIPIQESEIEGSAPLVSELSQDGSTDDDEGEMSYVEVPSLEADGQKEQEKQEHDEEDEKVSSFDSTKEFIPADSNSKSRTLSSAVTSEIFSKSPINPPIWKPVKRTNHRLLQSLINKPMTEPFDRYDRYSHSIGIDGDMIF